MPDKPSIAVIIPTYNRAADLVAAINSVLGQTCAAAEILVCDDGSADDSRERVEALGDARIRWLDCGRNGMPAIPRNIGMAQAKADWLAFLDSDDTWQPQKLEEQLKLVEKTGHKAVSSEAYRVRPGIENSLYLNYPRPVITFSDLLKVNYVICSSMMLHRSVIAITGGFPKGAQFKAIEDYALWLKVAAITNIDYVSAPLVNYNDNPAQSLRADDLDHVKQRELILTELMGWLNVCSVQHKKHYLDLARQEWELLHPSPLEKTMGGLKQFIRRLIKP